MNEGILAKTRINSQLWSWSSSAHTPTLLPPSVASSQLSFHLFIPGVCLNLSRTLWGRKMCMLRGEVKIFLPVYWPQNLRLDSPVKVIHEGGYVIYVAIKRLRVFPCRCLGTGPLGHWSSLFSCSPLHSRCERVHYLCTAVKMIRMTRLQRT